MSNTFGIDAKMDHGRFLADKENLDAEINRLRKEVAEAKQTAANVPDNHNYNEAETRDYFIDLLLKEAGWPLDQNRDREFPVTGMPNNTGEGFVPCMRDAPHMGLECLDRRRR